MHKTVLLKEIIDGLEIQSGDVVVDATVNGGGMSEEVCSRFGESIKLIAIDQDREALTKAKERLSKMAPDITFVEGNFRNLQFLLKKEGVSSIKRIMFDIGLSSNQLENSGRGFSFLKDEPLLMTFKVKPDENEFSAESIVNEWNEENLEIIIRSYGEERRSRKIARGIVEARKKERIKTSKQLAAIIERSAPRISKTHPATKTFQAIRIAVNDELRSLKEGLSQSFELLEKNGRIAVISFHSLEDRIVKNFMKEKAKEGKVLLMTKKPIIPGEVEQKQNPRSRSAKLRIAQKII